MKRAIRVKPGFLVAALLLCLAAPVLAQPNAPRVGGLSLGLDDRLATSRSTELYQLMEGRNASLLAEGTVDPDSYVLGPGDLVGLELIGTYSLSFEDVIGADGYVTFPQLGAFLLGNLTLSQARVRVRERGEGIVRESEVHLLLKATRSFKVFVSGPVQTPGTYPANAVTRVSELIQSSGGFKPTANMRKVVIRHRDGTVETADLLPFTLTGDLEWNPAVRDGDILLAEPRTDTVEFYGPFLYSGRFDYVESDELGRFLELLRFHPSADLSQATIQRYTDGVRWRTFTVDLPTVVEGLSEVPLSPGDRIMIRAIADWRTGATAEVRGAVRSPGHIPVVRGELTVDKAIEMTGGFLDDAVPTRIILGRPFLPDSTHVQDPSSSRNYLQSVTGQWLHEVIVDLTQGEGPVVDPGDVITVPRFEGWVEVLGQVKRPGFYNYHPDRTTEEYIEAAGGFAKFADKSKTRVSRGRFGDIGYARDIVVPAPGDVIWVPEKTPVSFWEVARDFLSVTSQAAALVLVVRELAP